MKILFFTLMISFLFTAGYSQQTPVQQKPKLKSSTEAAKTVYTCPMHPDVKSDEPGKCPKCGMTLVASNQTKGKMGAGMKMTGAGSSAGTVAKAISMLKDAKQKLVDAGKYNCCINTPCDRCLIDEQSCSCAKNVKAGEAVCSDCYAGWQRGDGVVEGVHKKDVKLETDGHDHGH